MDLLPAGTKYIQSKGRLLSLEKPVVMGILNATPNSFYNKGIDSDINGLLRNAEKMLNDGATILDIGGASTKPGEPLLSPDIELARILPVIEQLCRHFPDSWISVDTYNAQTARETIAASAAIINDISGGRFDASMLSTIASLRIPYIGMHIQGTPETMQQNPDYHHVVTEVFDELSTLSQACATEGITDVILDPGFGFGKSQQHNFSLLKNLGLFRILGKPILVGLSRKSMICKTLYVNPENALNGTTALHTLAILNGATILRAHDVKEARQVIQLMEWL